MKLYSESVLSRLGSTWRSARIEIEWGSVPDTAHREFSIKPVHRGLRHRECRPGSDKKLVSEAPVAPEIITTSGRKEMRHAVHLVPPA